MAEREAWGAFRARHGRPSRSAWREALGAALMGAPVRAWSLEGELARQEREVARLAGAIDDYQRVEMKLLASLNSLNEIQSTVIFAGTASGL